MLSLAEKQQLDQQEARIAHGLHKFHEIGAALVIIREKRLYRVGYASFREYCQQRWGIGRQYAYRLMAAAEVVAQLSPIGDILPRTESQARALARLDPARLRSVWAELTADGEQPTAAEIEEVIRRSGVAIPPAKEEILERVKQAEAEAARETKRLKDRDRIAAAERKIRQAMKLFQGLGEGVAEEVLHHLRHALAASALLVA
jgi:hypothetical protein